MDLLGLGMGLELSFRDRRQWARHTSWFHVAPVPIPQWSESIYGDAHFLTWKKDSLLNLSVRITPPASYCPCVTPKLLILPDFWITWVSPYYPLNYIGPPESSLFRCTCILLVWEEVYQYLHEMERAINFCLAGQLTLFLAWTTSPTKLIPRTLSQFHHSWSV